MKFFHPSIRLTNKKNHVRLICTINESNRSISIHLLFLFCSRIFILKSYENHSIKFIPFNEWLVFKRSSTFKLG